MNVFNIYVYENRSMSNDLSRPLMLENLNVDNAQIHIPKEIDGTDMGTWAWWLVYQNAKCEKYSIPMTLEGVMNDEGEEEYISTVSLNHGFTGKHGTAMYAIEAVQADGSGAVTHEWHTRTYKLEIVTTLQGNQTEYSETESDIISALISRVNELITSGAEIAEIAATIEAAAETAQEVIDSIPADYSTLSAQVDTNTKDIGELKADLEDLDDRVDALEAGGGGSGLTDSVKTALMDLVSHIGAWTDGDAQDYIDNLYDALYPPANLVSISAVYTQSGTVYEGSSINSLKSDLVVTALMSDQTTQTVTNYTLSGTLTAGTSTITVGYGGKTATFTVTVSALTYVQDGLVMWLDGEKNGADGAHETTLTTWVDQTGNGWDWTNSGATVGEKSVIFADNAHLNRNKNDLPQNVAMIEIAYKKTTGGCVLTGFGRTYLGNINMPSSSDLIVFHTASGSGSDKNTAFDASANTAHTANSAGYLDGVQIESFVSSAADWQYTYPCIGLYRGSGGTGTQYPFSGEIYCIRLYSRVLTEQEILHNASIDAQRFGIGA